MLSRVETRLGLALTRTKSRTWHSLVSQSVEGPGRVLTTSPTILPSKYPNWYRVVTQFYGLLQSLSLSRIPISFSGYGYFFHLFCFLIPTQLRQVLLCMDVTNQRHACTQQYLSQRLLWFVLCFICRFSSFLCFACPTLLLVSIPMVFFILFVPLLCRRSSLFLF